MQTLVIILGWVVLLGIIVGAAFNSIAYLIRRLGLTDDVGPYAWYLLGNILLVFGLSMSQLGGNVLWIVLTINLLFILLVTMFRGRE